MLAKCATMQALRAGWPDQFGGLYCEEELDRAKALDLAASELADRAREEAGGSSPRREGRDHRLLRRLEP